MAAENKFDKLRRVVYQGVPLEKPVQKTEQEKKDMESITVEANIPTDTDTTIKTVAALQVVEPAAEPDSKEVKESVEPVIKTSEPTVKTTESSVRDAIYQTNNINPVE